MISSIFYFADTEQEYLDNFNRRQVKPYTIVFCKDTHSVWKNGVRYGGSTSAETQSLISEIIDRDVAPLLLQLESAIQQANDATDRAEGRLSDISTQMDAAINDLQNAIDSEKARLDGKVDEINQNIEDRVQDILADYQDLVDNFEDNVANKIESLLDDAEWVQQNIPQAEVTWDSSWDLNVDNRMQVAGYWDVDPETGEKTTKWSKLEQSVDHIGTEISELSESVDGSIEAVNTRIDQTADSITTAANSISNIDGRLQTAESTITQVPDAIVAAVLTSSQTLNGNIATAKSEVIQKASEIVSQVTGVTVANDGTVDTTNTSLQQLITDEGNARAQLETQWANADADTKEVLEWMYSGLTTEAGGDKTFTELVAAAQDGDHSAISNITNLVEKVENEDGTFSYRAKSALTSAVDNALSGFISNTSSDYASALFFAELNSDIAGLKASTGDASALEGIVTKDSFAAELKAVASKDWAETTMATKLRVPKKNDNGDVVYDEQGNVVYEDVADVLGAMRTTIDVLDGGPQVTNSIDAKVNDAISTFEQKVNDGEACTTLVNKVDENKDNISAFVSKVTNDNSEASLATKMGKLQGGVVTNSGLDSAVSALLARGSNTRSSIYSKVDESTNKAIAAMAVDGGTRIVWTLVDPGFIPGHDFDVRNYDVDGYYIDIPGDLENPGGAWTIDHFASQINTINDGYLQWVYGQNVIPGHIFEFTSGEYYEITERSFKAGVLSEVDGKIGRATAGLVAEDELTGKVASVLATVGKDGSEITLDADQLNITSDFINAMNAELNVGSVTTELILAALAEGLTIKAGKVNFQKADGSPAPISIDVNDGTLHAVNAALAGAFTSTSDLAKIIIETADGTDNYDVNSIQNIVSSAIRMLAYNNLVVEQHPELEQEDEFGEVIDDGYRIEKTANSLLTDILTIGVEERYDLDDSNNISGAGYDGYIRIKSTSSDSRMATFSPDAIACSDGHGTSAGIGFGDIHLTGFSRQLTAEEKQQVANYSGYVPNGVKKYNTMVKNGQMSFNVVDGNVTLLGAYGSDQMMLGETNSNTGVNTYVSVVAGEDARITFDGGNPDKAVTIGFDGISIGSDFFVNWDTFKAKMR